MWAMISGVIEGGFAQAAAQVTWIPAHISAARMAAYPPSTSAGVPMTWRQWRANRLVDLLAKAAASQSRLPQHVLKWMRTADTLHVHMAATLGVVTHAATHFEHTAIGPGGRQVTHVSRDSAGQRPRRPRTWRRFPPQQAQQPPTSSSSTAAGSVRPVALLAPREKRRRLSEAHQSHERVQAAKRVAAHLAAIELQPSSAPSAADRMAALRARVQAKAQADLEWQRGQREASFWQT